ncbi:MAG: hypothetical protein EA374_08655 [Acholeplasmatales bacterium]|nr:MAG: hypothetical protein EA374_08655 [Acholeplasmatales bacterium]
MKRIWMVVTLALILFFSSACEGTTDPGDTPNGDDTPVPHHDYLPMGSPVFKQVSAINRFPALPPGYRYVDYRTMAQQLDKLLFSFAEDSVARQPNYSPIDQSTWTPLGFWIDQGRVPPQYDPLVSGFLGRTFGFPTYVGDQRLLASGPEGVTVIPLVFGSSLAGIDKRAQTFGEVTYDFVEMTQKFYDTGSRLVHNSGVQGQSFWYDIYPQIIFARLYHLYPDTPNMQEMVLNGADQWLKALPNFVKDGVVSYEFVGYNVVLEAPTTVGGHIEPPNGGLAFLFYSAYVITGDDAYLEGAKEVLDYLQVTQRNPNYEAMTDYAPWVAAILNARHGTQYDVGKFIDFLYDEDSAFRAGWAVMEGSFHGHRVEGLVGQAGDYAFSMNSFHLATTLAPLVRVDARYAPAVGRHFVNLVHNARVFFPHQMPLQQQTMPNFLEVDYRGVIPYEGFRNQYAGVNGLAMGDATTMFGQPSDLSLYSAAMLGGLGGLVDPTDVPGILRIDLAKADSFNLHPYQTYLYHNPHDVEHTVHFEAPEGRYDLFDTMSNRLVGAELEGDVTLRIPAGSAMVLVVLPANSRYVRDGQNIYANGQWISALRAAVNLPNLETRQSITSSYDIRFDTHVPEGDEVVRMRLFFNEIEVYDGPILEAFRYNKSDLPDTDYTFRVEITTRQGLIDTASKRIIAN